MQIEFLLQEIVERNALGRGMDRAIKKNIADEKLRAKIYTDAIKEKIDGDEFSRKERKFVLSLKINQFDDVEKE